METTTGLELPDAKGTFATVLQNTDAAESETELQARWNRVRDALRSAKEEMTAAVAATQSISDAIEAHEHDVHVQVDRNLQNTVSMGRESMNFKR
jgi:hypothetical protein